MIGDCKKYVNKLRYSRQKFLKLFKVKKTTAIKLSAA